MRNAASGKKTINYKLRDLALPAVSATGGEPFPVIHMDSGEIRLVPEVQLPVVLPDLQNFKPSGTGGIPLANATDWLEYTDPVTGEKGRRETNTMPQWAGSCWYYLRYIDPHTTSVSLILKKEKYWMPVDLYVGGAEHAVLSSALCAFLAQSALRTSAQSRRRNRFHRLVNQGMILGLSYKDSRGALVPNNLVELSEEGPVPQGNAGKSWWNFRQRCRNRSATWVNPDDVIREYGADSMRLYEIVHGPS